MAVIEERENKTGTSYKVVWYHKSVRQKPVTLKSRSEAEEWKRLIELHKGDQNKAARDLAKVKSSSPALSDVAEAHFSRLRAERFTIQTYESYMKNHIRPQLGSEPVAMITDDDIRRFIAHLETKLAVKTVHNIVGTLAGILDYAVKRGDIKASPYHHSMLPKAKPREEDDLFLTADEVRKVIGNVKAEWARDIFSLMLATGLRPAEARALQVKDARLDAKHPTVRVTKAMKQDKKTGDYVGPPKSQMSVRSIGLPPSAVEMLKRYTDGKNDSDQLFPGPNGGHLSRYILNWHWNKAVERSDLKTKPTLYALRHTHASLMLEAGMDIWKLSRHMGHGSVSITEKVYSHLMPEAHYQAAQLAQTFTAPAELTAAV